MFLQKSNVIFLSMEGSIILDYERFKNLVTQIQYAVFN